MATRKIQRPSPRRAAAARENGKKGGRPRKNRHVADFADLPQPPRNPVEIAHWMQRILAIEAWRIKRGRAHKELSQELRAYAYSMSKLLRPVIILVAADPDGAWWREASPDSRPDDYPPAVAYWLLLQLAGDVYRCIRGERTSGAEQRAIVTAYVKTLPPDTLHCAQQTIVGDMKAMAAQPGPEPKPSEEPKRGDEKRFQALSC